MKGEIKKEQEKVLEKEDGGRKKSQIYTRIWGVAVKAERKITLRDY